MRWWFSLVLAGCYAPTAPAGAPCAEGRTCPDGLVCETVGGADVCIVPGTLGPDAAIDAPDSDVMPPLDDRDGDGVANEQDVCPDVFDDQHDEDEDALGDACDPCPVYMDVGDSDADGLPDGCDPFPTSVGDRLALFHGFHTEPPGWTVQPGWSFSEDVASFSEAAVGTQFLTAPDGVTGTTVVVAQLQVGEFGMNAGVAVGLGTMVSGISCGLAMEGGMYSLLLFDIDAFVEVASEPIPSFNREVPWAIYLLRTRDGMVQCGAASGMTSVGTSSVMDSQPDTLQPFLVASAIGVKVDFLLVTTTTAQ